MAGRSGRFLTVAFSVAVLILGVAESSGARRDERISCVLSASNGSGTCPPFPNLHFQLGAEIAPMTLSRSELQPVALDLQGRVATTDGTHPSALREMAIELDRNVSIDSTGVPVCRVGSSRDIRRPPGALRRLCKGSIVGEGKADFEIAFPAQQPMQERSPMTIYNGGLHGGVQSLYVHAHIDVPVPAEIVSEVEVERVHQKRYGSQVVVKIPAIAGGSGALIDFDLRIKRLFELNGVRQSVVTARCPHGRLSMEASRVFLRNEAHTPGEAATTVIKGLLSIPCTPTR